jgi:hypothetical protein
MNQYFEIQKKRFGRLVKSSGINPVAAILLISSGFIGLSYLLLSNYQYGYYIYSILALILLLSLTKFERIQFLEFCFTPKTYSKIRIIENMIITLPFVIVLLIYSKFIIALSIIILGLLLTKLKINSKINWVVPTPFSKRPFELLIGFRKIFLLFLTTYILTAISISVNNFNLGVFSFGIQFFIITTFYLNQSEPQLYVWIHSLSPSKFIKSKIFIALTQSLILSLPILIILLINYPTHYLISLSILILGMLYLITAILFKYAYYPKLSIVQEMGFIICLLTPPILPIVIPILFFKAKNNLNPILND